MVIDYDAYKDAISILYEDRVRAISVETYEDDVTKVVKRKKIVVVDDAPCRLSFNSSSHVDDSTFHSKVKRNDVLTTGPDVIIPKGSDVIVTRADGTIYHYRFSDTPSIHLSHRRYELEKVDIS